jgi:hypothetical protein
VCEALMELVDTCNDCLRLQYEPPLGKRTGRPPFSVVNGQCLRGHTMIRVNDRWRCNPCGKIYAETKRQKRKAGA